MPVDLMAQGKAIFEIVEQHMNYDKTKSGYGNGDVVWACDSQTGNCTDFHSVFIALARGLGLPAKFEMGFPIGVESEGSVGGYHCWAWFYVKHQGWMPVDISEADKHPLDRNNYFGRLDADRVAFSTGRDIELIPASRTAPLNYFIYPHVEVDGEVWPIEKIDLNFYYQNVNEDKN
jgi:transglutaminase-like putative cysteine protease